MPAAVFALCGVIGRRIVRIEYAVGTFDPPRPAVFIDCRTERTPQHNQPRRLLFADLITSLSHQAATDKKV